MLPALLMRKNRAPKKPEKTAMNEQNNPKMKTIIYITALVLAFILVFAIAFAITSGLFSDGDNTPSDSAQGQEGGKDEDGGIGDNLDQGGWTPIE